LIVEPPNNDQNLTMVATKSHRLYVDSQAHHARLELSSHARKTKVGMLESSGICTKTRYDFNRVLLIIHGGDLPFLFLNSGFSGSLKPKAPIAIGVDQTAPILRIEAPEDKSITSNSRIDIRGMVNDAVEALHGAPESRVSISVNGQTITTASQNAQVSDRYFLIPEVPLQIGNNQLRITATDHLGNARSQELRISRISAGSERLTLLGGNHQSAPINIELAKPLQVVALNAQGEPVANLPISFDVLRGSGSISTTQGAPTKPNGLTVARNLTVTTDQFGRAQVWMTVGKQSGPGANAIKASHPRLSEEVIFSANTQRGQVARINADLGTNQIAETNAQPLELLSAVVRDAFDNVLPNVPVVFTIEEGEATFPDTPGATALAWPSCERAGLRNAITFSKKNKSLPPASIYKFAMNYVASKCIDLSQR
jgi:hypothetical protein